MKRLLLTLPLIMVLLTAVLLPSVSALSINVVDENDSATESLMAGEEATWSWYVYNNNSTPVYLMVEIAITDGSAHLDSYYVYIDGSEVSNIQIDPQEGSYVEVTLSTGRLSSTADVLATVYFNITNLGDTSDTFAMTENLSVQISSLYFGEGSYNKVLGIFENPLPAPLDTPIGALALTLLCYLLIGALLFYLILPSVVKNLMERSDKNTEQMIKILRWPVSLMLVLYAFTESFYIVGAGETTLETITVLVTIGYLVLGADVAWALYRLIVRRLLTDFNKRRSLGEDLSLLPLLNWIGKIGISLIALSSILATLGFDIMVILTGAGILGLAISLGAQDTLNKFFSGLSLLIERPFKQGDLLEMEDGTVVEVIRVGLRSTTFYNTFDPQYLTIPNDLVANTKIVNILRPDPRYKAKVDVGVAYGSNIELVKKVMMEAAMEHPEVIKNGEDGPLVRFMGFGDSSLDFRLFTWVNDFREHYRITAELREAIDAKFRLNKIEIPFPQRDVWMRSKGQ